MGGRARAKKLSKKPHEARAYRDPAGAAAADAGLALSRGRGCAARPGFGPGGGQRNAVRDGPGVAVAGAAVIPRHECGGLPQVTRCWAALGIALAAGIAVGLLPIDNQADLPNDEKL